MKHLVLLSLWAATMLAGAADYAVVVSEKTRSDADWHKVVKALQEKHRGEVIVFTNSVEESLAKLQQLFPRYACFVAQPDEANRAFVAKVHQLTRRLDDDPYTDCLWGIVTGYDAAAALCIATWKEGLTVRKVAGGTEIALECCEEGVCYDELVKNKCVKKEKGGEKIETKGPDDTTEALVKTLTEYQADLFVTSGHATERDWQIGYRYRNGSFRCANGQLYGLDSAGKRYQVDSPNPKVYLPIGNCLMGHIDSRESMALAWMNNAGVKQMIGYTVLTWYGYAGWGCLDYFVEQPGRYTFAQAFFANQHALIHRLQTCATGAERAKTDSKGNLTTSFALTEQGKAEKLTANDIRGLLYDRDTVAFYGDPAWEARLAKGPVAWTQSLTEKEGVWTFVVKPARGEKTFAPINKSGSQRGYRPIVEFLPRRMQKAEVIEGAELKPILTDDFILVPNPKMCEPEKTYKIVFR